MKTGRVIVLGWLAVVFVCVVSAVPVRAGEIVPLGKIEQKIPADILVMIEGRDLSGFWNGFEQSNIRRMVKGIPPAELGLGMLKLVSGVVVFQVTGMTIDKFAQQYGKHAAIVVYDAPFNDPEKMTKKPVAAVFFDAGTNAGGFAAQIDQRFSIAAGMNNPNAKKQFGKEQYGGTTLYTVNTPGEDPFAVCFLGQLFVVGDPTGVRAAIDNAKKTPHLSSDKGFLATRERVATRRGITVYLNFKRLLDAAEPELRANPEKRRDFDNLGLSSIQWIGGTSTFHGGMVRDKSYVYCGQKLSGLLKLIATQKAGTTHGAKFIPSEAFAFASAKFESGEKLWQALREFVASTGGDMQITKVDDQLDQIQLQFGINLRSDFINCLGNELFAGIAIENLAQHIANGTKPDIGDVPFAVGVQVKKREVLEATIQQIIFSQPLWDQGVTRNTEQYKGIEISIIQVPNEAAKPVYAFVDDYLLFAPSPEVLKKCIDAWKSGNNLGALAEYKKLAAMLPRVNTLEVCVNVPAIAEEIMPVVQQNAPPQIAANMPQIRQAVSNLSGLLLTLEGDATGLKGSGVSTFGSAGLFGGIAVLSTLKPGRARPAR